MAASAPELQQPKRRKSPAPRMPLPRCSLLVLERAPAGVGLLFWRFVNDLETWRIAPETECLFAPPDLASWRTCYPDELAAAFHTLETIWLDPARAVPGALIGAAQSVWEWCERNDSIEAALHFSEWAARVDEENPAFCRIAGYFARMRGETRRAEMWFRRARRLARIHKNEPEFVKAHLGLGSIAADLGLLDDAASHATRAFKAALRCGQHKLAGWAYHDLMLLKIGLGRYDEAWAHGLDAIALYKRDHPRMPALAHDLALLWSRQGYFSAAMTVYERVLPHLSRPHERVVVLSNFIRAAAACGDRLRYERGMQQIEQVRAEGGIIPASAWVHLAHAAHTAQDWSRADELIQASLAHAHDGYLDMSRKLADEIVRRSGGDVDILPSSESGIDEVRDELLRRLARHTAPGWGPGTMPPEKFPLN